MHKTPRSLSAPEKQLENIIQLIEAYLDHEHKDHPKIDVFRERLSVALQPIRHFVRQYGTEDESDNRADWVDRKLGTLLNVAKFPYELESQIRTVIRNAQKKGEMQTIPREFSASKADWEAWIDKKAPKDRREALRHSLNRLLSRSRRLVRKVMDADESVSREEELVIALNALVDQAKLPADIAFDLNYLFVQTFLPAKAAAIHYQSKAVAFAEQKAEEERLAKEAEAAKNAGPAPMPLAHAKPAGEVVASAESQKDEPEAADESDQPHEEDTQTSDEPTEDELDPELLPKSDGPQADSEPTPESPFDDQDDDEVVLELPGISDRLRALVTRVPDADSLDDEPIDLEDMVDDSLEGKEYKGPVAFRLKAAAAGLFGRPIEGFDPDPVKIYDQGQGPSAEEFFGDDDTIDGGENPYGVDLPESEDDEVVVQSSAGEWLVNEASLEGALNTMDTAVGEPVESADEESWEAQPVLLTNPKNGLSDADLPEDVPVFDGVQEAQVTPDDVEESEAADWGHQLEKKVLLFLQQNARRLWDDEELGMIIDGIRLLGEGKCTGLKYKHLANALRMQVFEFGNQTARFPMVVHLHQKEIAANPAHKRSYFDYARTLYANGQLEDALEQLEKGFAAKIPDTDFNSEEKAVELLAQIKLELAKQANVEEIITSATHMKWSQEELEKMKQAFEKDLFIADPNRENPYAIRSLAVALKYQLYVHQNELIDVNFLNAVHLADIAGSPDDGEAYFIYADSLEKSFRWEEAMQAYQLVIAKNCTDTVRTRATDKVEYLKQYTTT